MEEGRNTAPERPTAPNEPGAAGLSHETLILPKSAGVLESARAEAEAAGTAPAKDAEPEETAAGERLKMILLTLTVTWLSWLLSLLAQLRSSFTLRKTVYTSFFVCGVASVLLYGIRRIAAAPGLLLRSAFAGCALSFLLSSAVLALEHYCRLGTVELVWLIVFMMLFCAMLLLSLVRIGYRIFGQMQTRLSEWMATLFAAGLLMAAAMGWLNRLPASGATSEMAVVYMMASVVLTVAGSTWSWTVARRLDEEAPRRRLGLMFIGWLLVAGLVALSVFSWCVIIVVVEDWSILRYDSTLREMFYCSMLGTVLMLPGLLVQRRAKRAVAARRRR